MQTKSKASRLLAVLLAMVMVLSLMPITTVMAASDDVKINARNFPDEAFREYISGSLDMDQNGSLSAEEIAKVKSLSNFNNVQNLEGIKFFTSLESIHASYSKITNADVSGMTSLKSVSFRDGLVLESINVDGCTSLKNIDLTRNSLSSIDISGCPNLEGLYIGNNKFTTLKLEHSNLRRLECERNQMTSLDVSGCPKMSVLKCGTNNLSTLDVSALTELTELVCSENNLKVIDLEKNTKLTSLMANKNKLTSIDVSASQASRVTINAFTNVYGVALDADRKCDLSKLPGKFDVTKASNWKGGTVSGNILTFNEGVTKVTYDYNCGTKSNVTFTLEIHTHDFTVLSCDETNHWNACECGEPGEKSVHGFELVNAVEATAFKDGYTGDQVCSVCGYTIEGEVIPATGLGFNCASIIAIITFIPCKLVPAIIRIIINLFKTVIGWFIPAK